MPLSPSLPPPPRALPAASRCQSASGAGGFLQLGLSFMASKALLTAAEVGAVTLPGLPVPLARWGLG